MKIKDTLAQVKAKFLSGGIENPALEAKLILEKVTGLKGSKLIVYDDKDLTPTQEQDLNSIVLKRLQNYPLAYLLGHREFWSLDLKVTEDTLIPRPDTETLVEEALAEEFKSALDLGTGTGAIILSLKKERPYAHCVAVELNPRTLEIAKENALLNKLHVDFRLGFWFEPLEKGEIFDLIVSNPPYIEENDQHLRQNGLNFEPQGALVSGPQGLDDLKIIIANAPKFLKKGGRLLVEHGFNQGAAVRELFFKASFSEVKTICDLGGNERVTCGRYL